MVAMSAARPAKTNAVLIARDIIRSPMLAWIDV
jgi:hypothetical protein